MNSNFEKLDRSHLEEINGGFGIVAIAVAVAGGIAAGVVIDEVVERKTGTDIAGHIGNALTIVGEALNNGE